MPTVNEHLLDDAIRHAEALSRYSNFEVQRLIGLLNRTDAALAARLTEALESAGMSDGRIERLDTLLQSVRALNAQAYAALGRELEDGLRKLAEQEAGYQLELFRAVIPPQVVVSVGVAQVSAEQAFAAAMSRPFQGRLLREWAASMEAGRMARIRDEVRQGYVNQEPIADIVRRVRGTRAQKYADGLLQASRREAEAVVRTAVAHTAAVARGAFLEANKALVKAQVWVATLDSSTTPICRVRDGSQWTLDHKPIGHKFEWLGGAGKAHWGCRSTMVPVTKSWQELGLDLPDMPESTRASMDGQVPADQTYGQWLRKQSAERQDDILGPTRGALFRRGGLEIERFANDKGRWLTLDELKARDAAAFARIGVT